jgi:ribose 5-phosphate isomerase B
MKISIGSDHAGFELKELLRNYLSEKGVTVADRGTYDSESTDYPDFAHAVADDVEGGSADLGIVICGSANGVAMTANKHKGIRCAICWNAEISQLARAHNDANVAALPARFLTDDEAYAIIDRFLTSEFEGGRHRRRVDKIPC